MVAAIPGRVEKIQLSQGWQVVLYNALCSVETVTIFVPSAGSPTRYLKGQLSYSRGASIEYQR